MRLPQFIVPGAVAAFFTLAAGCDAPIRSGNSGSPERTSGDDTELGDGDGDGGTAAEVRIGAAGDFGGRDEYAGTVMSDMMVRDLDAFFLLGDTSYSEIVPETAWCDWAHSYLGPDYPLEVVAGNHEEDSEADGFILEFADCMPDRLDSDLGPGGYSVNFASNLGPVTFISTSPDLSIDGVKYTYEPGTPERDWLGEAIAAAQNQGDWVVVGMHKNCITIGNKTCEIGESFAQFLVDAGVDLVLQGHDHDYQRTHSLASVVEGGVGTIADPGDDDDYQRGAGTVFAIVGTAGRGVTACSHSDSEYGNFATHWCGEEAGDTKGYMMLTVDSSRLTAEYISTAGTAFSDVFVIR
jgi:hypothetical protein